MDKHLRISSVAYDSACVFTTLVYKSSDSGTSIFACDADNMIEEVNAIRGVVVRYSQTENIDQPLAMLRGSITSYYQADDLGSITSLSTTAPLPPGLR